MLHQGDISKLPPGKALLFIGADWWLVNARMHWKDHVVAAGPVVVAGGVLRTNRHAISAADAPVLTMPLKTLETITENGDRGYWEGCRATASRWLALCQCGRDSAH